MNNLPSQSQIDDVETFIRGHWDETVRRICQDDGTVIGLPFPYTVPCRKGSFQEMYYWDTYFTCLGLIQSGRKDLAVSNLRNFLYLVGRYQFIPNGSRTYYLNRSQPPYLAPLVSLLLNAGLDEKLAAESLTGIMTEYRFWETRRTASNGLAHYGNHASTDFLREFFVAIKDRAQLGGETDEERLVLADHTLAEAESGWDFTPRFEHRCLDFSPVDLNSNLFLYEQLLSTWLGGAERQQWRDRAALRSQRMTDLCWNAERGAFFDYDNQKHRQGTVLAASAFHPLWAGIATPDQAAQTCSQALPRLELDYGIVPCEPGAGEKLCQWDAPNAWPCLQTIVYRGLARYGFVEDARRVAGKYVSVVCRGFAETGDLWEKYNAQDGSAKSKEEAGWTAPAMMGWTAGVFLDAAAFLRETAPAMQPNFPREIPPLPHP